MAMRKAKSAARRAAGAKPPMIHYDVPEMWADSGLFHIVSITPDGPQEHLITTVALMKFLKMASGHVTSAVIHRLVPGGH